MPFGLAFAVALTWTDLPSALRPADEAALQAELRKVESATERRLEEGEQDHLIFYLLQGRAFTSLPAIEPVLSAKQFVEAQQVPEAVTARLDALLNSRTADVRSSWARQRAQAAGREQVLQEYGRAMRFLYDKEWATRSLPPSQRRATVAKLYETRGHSSDTSPDSEKAVEAGLALLKDAKLRDVLVIGPGIDFAPRTALRDDAPPRSYQMNLLRRLLPDASVECIDVNPRVVEMAGCVERVNILTEHRDRRYDLIVITNVFVYFTKAELTFALANIAAMLKPGGYLLHNELRDEMAEIGQFLRLPVINARSIKLKETANRALFDAVVLHRSSIEQ